MDNISVMDNRVLDYFTGLVVLTGLVSIVKLSIGVVG